MIPGTVVRTAEDAECAEGKASGFATVHPDKLKRLQSRFPCRFACFAVPTAVLGLVAVVGCHSQPVTGARSPDSERQRAIIEARAARVFTNAVLIKPRETLPTTDLAFALAPLLIQEVAGSNALSNRGPVTIYYQLGAAQIAGVTRPQMTYRWFEGNEETRRHGVRLTLDSHGLPVIWEVLDDRTGPRVLFVSRSLEEKAQLAYGPPAPGRQFSIEQPVNLAPDVVVARVIEDGPVTMGPIVHESTRGEINAVICRCMPTQARHLVATDYYELKPLPGAVKEQVQMPGAVENLDRQLQLPPTF